MKKIILNILFLACALQVSAQGSAQSKSKFFRKLQKTVWTLGLSGVVIDDDGKPFKSLFNVSDSWSFLPFPTQVKLEGYIDKGFSAEGAFTFSQLKAGKIENGRDVVRKTTVNLIAFDALAKYDLNELFGDTKFFSPYAVGGLGYTYRGVTTQKNGIMFDIGLGFTLWFYKGFGLNAQSMAKFAINSASSNYLQHSVGVVYRFNLLTGYKTPGRLGHRYNLFRNS